MRGNYDCQSAGASLGPLLVTKVCSVTAAWTEDVLTLLLSGNQSFDRTLRDSDIACTLATRCLVLVMGQCINIHLNDENKESPLMFRKHTRSGTIEQNIVQSIVKFHSSGINLLMLGKKPDYSSFAQLSVLFKQKFMSRLSFCNEQ